MTLEELMKKASSLHLEERPSGKCIGTYITDYEAFYFYGPDEGGRYRYETAADRYYKKLAKKKKRKLLHKELKEMINIYIDTDMKGMRGDAGYGYYLEWDRPGMDIETREGYGVLKDTTRNRLFLHAAIEALGRIRKAEELHIYLPCQYVAESANKGLPELWCLNNWIKGDRTEVKNCDLWEKLVPKLKELCPIWHDGKHAYSEVIQRNLKEKNHGTE